MTKRIEDAYTFVMSNKGPKGYKEQLVIALELKNGLKPVAVAEKLNIPKPTVYGIAKHLDKGWKPDLSEEAIANAPSSPGYMGKSSASHGEGSEETEAEKEAKKLAQKEKDAHPASGYIALAAIQIRCQYTPMMYMARLAAEDKWAWPGNLPFEDFIDTILYQFFKDRGIVLQGYIVEDEVDSGGNGHIKALEGKIEELTKLVKEGAAQWQKSST